MKSVTNSNAPFIREIIDRTQDIGGIRISGNNQAEIKNNTINLLKAQMANAKSNQNTPVVIKISMENLDLASVKI